MDSREFLFQHKNRCVGRMLAELEREIFPLLPKSSQKRVRDIVKTKIATYHNEVITELESDRGMEHNALAMKVNKT